MDFLLRKIKFRFAPIKVPIIDWLPEYNKNLFYNDLNAGFTIFFLIVPQSMAYALLSGFPAVYGLYSATIPLFIYTLLGTSRQISLGPMAITSLLLGVTLQKYGYAEESPEAITVGLNISMMVGLILFGVGICRLGTLVNLISNSVLVGFITGSAIVIIVNQLKYIFGLVVPRYSNILQTLYYIVTHLHEADGDACALGLLSTAALVGIREAKKRIKTRPRSWHPHLYTAFQALCNFSNFLILMLGMAVAKGVYDSGGQMPIVGMIPSGMLPPGFIFADGATIVKMIPDAFALAFVSFAGNWAICKRYAWDNGYEVEATQELIAEGLTNIIGVVFHCFVVSGGLGRSAVNAGCGAKTQIASCITALCVLVCVLFLTSLLYYIPMASLGAVLEVAVLPLIAFDDMAASYRVDRRDCLVMVVTCLITMFVGVAEGLFSGIFVSTAVVLWASAFPNIVHLGRLDHSKTRATSVSESLRSFQPSPKRPSGGESDIAGYLTATSARASPVTSDGEAAAAEEERLQSLAEDTSLLMGEQRHYYRNVDRYADAVQLPGFAIVRMDASLYYANCAYFKETVLGAARGEYHSDRSTPIRKVIIDASVWVTLDLSAVKTLFELKSELLALRVGLAIVCAKGYLRDQLKSSNFLPALGRENLNMSIDDAIMAPPLQTSNSADASPTSPASPPPVGSSGARGESTGSSKMSTLISSVLTSSTMNRYVQLDEEAVTSAMHDSSNRDEVELTRVDDGRGGDLSPTVNPLFDVSLA